MDSINGSESGIFSPRHLISLIDLTNLDDGCDEQAVIALCRRADEHRTAAVCVWPDFVARAARELADSPVVVATVVNFPSGDDRPHAVGVLTERAVNDGADEVDVVLPYRSLAAGDRSRASEVLRVVRAVCATEVVVKVILETGELSTPQRILEAAELAIGEGADFIKTSTGKSPVSATRTAAEVMIGAISAAPRTVGFKPSGGIRTVDDAALYATVAAQALGRGYLEPATFRFGASGLLEALLAAG